MKILAHLRSYHFPQTHFNVNTLVVQPADELSGVLLASVVEIQAQIGVDPDSEVVVHHEDLGIVLARRTCYNCSKCSGKRRL